MRALSFAVPGVLAISLVTPAPQASAEDAARHDRSTASARPLAGLAVADRVERRSGGRWPGRRITYSDKLSPSYDWAINHAVAAWNKGSGAKIKFVRAASGKRGDVLIKRAPTPGSAGQATLGHVPNAWVHLAPGIGKTITREDWIQTSVLIAHELGHVLGLSHTDRPNRLMYPYIPQHTWYGDGTMSCRWVTKRDAKPAIRLYGGQLDLAPRRCKVERFAPPLVGVTASGGNAEATPVTLAWGTPSGIPPRSKIYVQVNLAGDCGGGSFVEFDVLSPTATSWTDPDNLHEFGEYCYSVTLQNFWGGGAPWFRTTR